MHGVMLDAESLGNIDLSELTSHFTSCDVFPTTVSTDIQQRIANAEVVLTNKIQLDAAAIGSAAKLKLICVLATGTNNVDLIAASKHKIPVCNAVGYGTPSVAQHTINLMLNLATQQIQYQADVREGLWQQSKVFTRLDHPIIELSGKTLGIVGHGELGSAVARLGRAFGMEILLAARTNTDATDTRLPLKDLLPQVDFLSLHCPLTADTENLINASSLALMKPGAFLINTARGGLVDSNALVAALSEGRLAGAAIDVLNQEPPGDDEPLLQHLHLKNLIVTPHNAWGAIESRRRLIKQTQENIRAFLAGKLIRCVNQEI